MKRALESPWIVALVVLALAVLPVLAALKAHRDQARRAEALLFERSADVVAAHLRLLTGRQVGWLNGVRTRLSNRAEPPEAMLGRVFSRAPRHGLPENCSGLAYASVDGGQLDVLWQRAKPGIDVSAAKTLLQTAPSIPEQVVSAQSGPLLVTAMRVGENPSRQPGGWLLAWWDLDAMCADPHLRLVTQSQTLTARPADDVPRVAGLMVEIHEGGVQWWAEIDKGAGFHTLFSRLPERAIALTGGACALLLAMLAGFAVRSSGLRASLASQREMVRMKDHLLHSVSHEFRTPLSVILSSTDLLESYAERLPPERRADALAQIRDSTVRMNEMVGQVLLLSRIEASRLPVTSSRLDLVNFSRELARTAETAAQGRCPIRVIAPESLDVEIDPTLLRAVLGNLLSNGVKFSLQGQPVDFEIGQTDRLWFSVRDHGCGITGEDLPHVYEPFFRSSAVPGVPGTGLGLTIARKCALLLGGTLTLESGPTGTTATLVL
jgi:signal transduction histidine kinase